MYHLQIQHDEKTLINLFRTQYYAFGKVKIAARFVIGFLMIICAAAFYIPMWAKGILLLAGAWLVSTPDFPARTRADKAIQARANNFPKMLYDFREDNIKISDGKNAKEFPYEKIILLVRDNNYAYIFLDKNSVCMAELPNSENAREKFFAFVENKTGLKFTRQKSFFAMNIHDLIRTKNSR